MISPAKLMLNLFDKGATTMDIRPVETDTDYHTALEEIERLMTAAPDSPDGERLDVLVTLVEAYENKHYPLDLTDPKA